MMRYWILFYCLLLLSACSSQSVLPTDHYYRLPELTTISSGERQLGAISIINFQADGLYRERALVYTDDQVELKQYHYHHWVDAPTRLLQERLAENLRLRNLANIILTTFDGNSELIIKGKIKSFDIVAVGDNRTVHVKIILQANLSTDKLPVLHKEYIKAVRLDNDVVLNAVNAFGEAVDLIFAEFYGELIQAI